MVPWDRDGRNELALISLSTWYDNGLQQKSWWFDRWHLIVELTAKSKNSSKSRLGGAAGTLELEIEGKL